VPTVDDKRKKKRLTSKQSRTHQLIKKNVEAKPRKGLSKTLPNDTSRASSIRSAVAPTPPPTKRKPPTTQPKRESIEILQIKMKDNKVAYLVESAQGINWRFNPELKQNHSSEIIAYHENRFKREHQRRTNIDMLLTPDE
jgi:hypothetical protein